MSGKILSPINDSNLAYRALTVTLAANAEQKIDVAHQTFKVLQSTTSNLSDVSARPLGTSNYIDVSTSFGYRTDSEQTVQGFYYQGVYLRNNTGAPITLVLGMGFGEIVDDRVIIVGSIISQPASPTGWTTGQVSVDNTADLIIAANSSRASVTITAGTSDLYIGTSGAVTTGTGFLIPAGGAHTLTHLNDVYGIRAGAAAAATYSQETY